jgi:uncharacterized protein
MRHPSIPYVLPFAVFMAMLALRPRLPLGRLEYPVWIVVLTAVLVLVSRSVIDLRVSRPLATVALGVAVFVIWIGPDILWPGYRSHWLFQNAVTGSLETSIVASLRSDTFVIVMRILRAAVLVPIVEELFWRAWLMRWLINPDFRGVALGTYARLAFWVTALLFASEHGPYWDVGLLAGIAYNWWMVRTRSLGDVILAHAVTNACLSAYVLAAGKWEYWM